MFHLFEDFDDYSDKNVLVGLSGGINSAAVLCWLAGVPEDCKPKELHLYYAHFNEHSDDTLPFVLDLWTYATTKFKDVRYYQTDNSVLEYFEKENMIPHPILSPCSKDLKILPMVEYAREHNIDLDLVGYVREEVKRYNRAKSKQNEVEKAYPIMEYDNEWCFQIVKKEIGWYPKIYDILDKKGKRVFKHNNCLPCKNMDGKDYMLVKKHFPEKYEAAEQTSKKLNQYFGRKEGYPGCSICSF